MNKKTLISLGIGITLSVPSFYLAFRNVPFQDLILYFGKIRFMPLIPSILLVLTAFFLRSARWKVILSGSHEIRFWNAYHPLMIGFMMNCIFPGRVGEIARPAILCRKEQAVSFSSAMATVVTERLFDIISLMVFFAVTARSYPIDPNLDITFGGYHLNIDTLDEIIVGLVKLTLAIGIFLVAIGYKRTRDAINALILRIPSLLFLTSPKLSGWVRSKICEPFASFVEQFASGLSVVKRPAAILSCALLSGAIWLVQGASYYAVSLACPDIGLSFGEVMFYMLMICFFIALPSVPGYWGLWEAGGMFALTLAGIPQNDAAGFTLLNHAIQVFPVIIAGFVSAWLLGTRFRHFDFSQKSSGNQTLSPIQETDCTQGRGKNL